VRPFEKGAEDRVEDSPGDFALSNHRTWPLRIMSTVSMPAIVRAAE
jgi:hypothetical protein